MGEWGQTISFRTSAEPILNLEIFDGPRNLRRWLALDNHRLDFQSIKHRIAEQLADIGTQLMQPALVRLVQNALRQRHQVRRDAAALHAKEHDAARPFARKRRRILQRRPRMWREIRREQNIFKRIHKN